MAKKEEAKKDEAASGFSMPDMSKVMSVAKGAVSFVQTHVMSLVKMCKDKCCPAKDDKKAKKE